MRISVDLALRNRRCKCSRVIPKGTYHLRGDGFREQENICPECAKEMVNLIDKNNEARKNE